MSENKQKKCEFNIVEESIVKEKKYSCTFKMFGREQVKFYTVGFLLPR